MLVQAFAILQDVLHDFLFLKQKRKHKRIPCGGVSNLAARLQHEKGLVRIVEALVPGEIGDLIFGDQLHKLGLVRRCELGHFFGLRVNDLVLLEHCLAFTMRLELGVGGGGRSQVLLSLGLRYTALKLSHLWRN